MGSPCELLCEAENESEATLLTNIAAREAWRIEDKFSRYQSGNIVDQINTAGGAEVKVDAETARLVEFATQLHEMSAGCFDITSGALRRAWRFDGSDQIPPQRTLAAVLRKVGWHKVVWTGTSITMPSGMEIDFGGVGKEYAVDRAVGLLRERSKVACLTNFGGDLAVTHSPRSRESWQVGIESLQGNSPGAERVISLKVGALATSGDARRYLLKEGIRYGHILDPRTGWPVKGAPRSISVASDTCVQAGMLSTLAMLEGLDAEEFLTAQKIKFWCLR